MNASVDEMQQHQLAANYILRGASAVTVQAHRILSSNLTRREFLAGEVSEQPDLITLGKIKSAAKKLMEAIGPDAVLTNCEFQNAPITVAELETWVEGAAEVCAPFVRARRQAK